MNSFILTSIAAFFRSLPELFKNSALYSVIDRIYAAFSRAWRSGKIVNTVEKEPKRGTVVSSAVWRLCRLPFTAAERLRDRIYPALEKAVSKSVICRTARLYVQNFMALNTRFFGIMLVAMSAAYLPLHMLSDGRISKLALAAAAVGAILLIMNYNAMNFLNTSKLVDFIKSAAGFRQLDFSFFDEEYTRGRGRLVCGAVIGALTGAVMSVKLIYGTAVPFAAFGALLVMMYPITGIFAAVFLAPIVPTMILAGVCLWTGLSVVINSLLNKDFKWKFTGLGLNIFIFLAVLFVSSVLSFAPSGSIKVWIMYFVFAGFYFILTNTVKTKAQLYSLMRVFAISGALVALYGVLQYVFGWTTANAWIDETMFENDTMRVYSTLANPNVLGEYLLLALPIAAVFVLSDKCRHLSKWVYIGIFGLLGLCLVLTQSRGCWIGFMAAAVIFVTFYEGRLWGLLPLALLILPMIVPDTIVERIASVGNMEDSSTSYRVYIWFATFGMLKHYWPGGIGMGEAAFNHVYPLFMYNAVIAPHSHNTFLQLLVESGISGLLVFLIMQIVFLKNMHSVYRTDDKKHRDSIAALAMGCGVIGFLIQSLFDYTFYNYRVMAIFFMVLAMGTALKSIKFGEEEAY